MIYLLFVLVRNRNPELLQKSDQVLILLRGTAGSQLAGSDGSGGATNVLRRFLRVPKYTQDRWLSRQLRHRGCPPSQRTLRSRQAVHATAVFPLNARCGFSGRRGNSIRGIGTLDGPSDPDGRK